jgi:hypothetical protein
MTGNLYLNMYIVTDLNNALPGNSSVYTAQHATIEKPVSYVDLTDASIDSWIANTVHVFTADPCPFRGYISRAVTCKFRANWN